MKKFFYFIQDVSKTSRVFLALMKFLQQKNDTNSVAVKEKYFKKINQRNSISDATIGFETRNGRCCLTDQNFDYFLAVIWFFSIDFWQDREFIELENPFNGQPQSMQRSTGSRSTSPTTMGGGQPGSIVSPTSNVRNKPQRSSASSPLSPDRLSQQQHSAMCPCCSCWTCLPLHQRSSATSPVTSPPPPPPPPVLLASSGPAHLAVRFFHMGI